MSGWTVQSLIDSKMTLTAFCSVCNRHSDLDLEAMRDKLGPNAPAMADDITPKLRCKNCGAKSVGLIYRPDTFIAPPNPTRMCG